MSARTLIRGVFILIILIAIAIFMFFRLAPVIQGPQILESNLDPTSFQDEYVIDLRLRVAQTHQAHINGISVDISQDDLIEESLPLAPGHNTIQVSLSNTLSQTRIITYTIVTPPLENSHLVPYALQEEE